jgi:hypothetical protein
MAQLSLHNNEKIILADMNIDLFKHAAQFDVNVHKYLLALSEFGYTQVIRSPNFRDLSLLDHLAISDDRKFTANGQFPFGGSDHQLIYTIRKGFKNYYQPRTISCRNWNDIDWLLLDRDISEHKPDINNNPISIDTEFIRFNNHVMNMLNKYAPLKKKIVKGKLTPWMTSDIAHLMKQRNKAHRRALSTKSHEDWRMYRVARNECNRKLNQGKKLYFQDKFQKATESSSLWKTVDELTRFRSKVKQPISVLTDANNSLVYETSAIYDLLAEEFIVNKDNAVCEELLSDQIKTYSDSYDYSNSDRIDMEPISISQDDVMSNIKSTKIREEEMINIPQFSS